MNIYADWAKIQFGHFGFVWRYHSNVKNFRFFNLQGHRAGFGLQNNLNNWIY